MAEAREDPVLTALYQDYVAAVNVYDRQRDDMRLLRIARAHLDAFEIAMAHVRVLH